MSDLGDRWEVDLGQESINGTIEVINVSGVVLLSLDVHSGRISITKPNTPGVFFLRWDREGEIPLVEKVVAM